MASKEKKTKTSTAKGAFTPDMKGKVRSTGLELSRKGREEILDIISQNEILCQYIDFFQSLSDEELESIVNDATEFAIDKMEENA